MMAALFLILAFGCINYVRGRGMISYASHAVASIAWGIVTGIAANGMGYALNYSIALALITAVGMLIWLVGVIPGWGGWGRYFASWTWQWDNDPEVPPIDWIGLKLVPLVTTDVHWTNGLRGTICMSLRGLYILPLFYGLQCFSLGIIIGLMQGITYGSMHWLAPANKGTEYAEPAYAAIVGAAIAGLMYGGF